MIGSNQFDHDATQAVVRLITESDMWRAGLLENLSTMFGELLSAAGDRYGYGEEGIHPATIQWSVVGETLGRYLEAQHREERRQACLKCRKPTQEGSRWRHVSGLQYLHPGCFLTWYGADVLKSAEHWAEETR